MQLFVFCVFNFQKAYMCELMGKSPDILVDSLRDLVYGRFECNAERLAFIEE